ncbi:hypothetical protein SPFM15_00036 [Salmonella phage SPFM15]|nr:hypothetical protein SPFM5_00031 [Salmonella phage SPFM5]VFR13365.1 hypothetical protein SPFM14_00030 [Salmonella phage SPFM14]VFR13660.1 hypothetical protein SPFM15_00036 [Salmonella phage SPFM15]
MFDDDNKFSEFMSVLGSCDIQVTIRDLSRVMYMPIVNLSLQFGTGGLGWRADGLPFPFYLECYSRGRYSMRNAMVTLSFWLAAVCPLATGKQSFTHIPLRCWSGNDLDVFQDLIVPIDFPEVWDSSDTSGDDISLSTGALDFLHLSGIMSLYNSSVGGKTGFDAVDGLITGLKSALISGTVNSATQKARSLEVNLSRVDGRDTVGRSFSNTTKEPEDGLTSNIASEIRNGSQWITCQKESVGSVFKDYIDILEGAINSMDENNLDIGKIENWMDQGERMAQVEKNQAQVAKSQTEAQGGKAENFENEGDAQRKELADNKEDELVAGMNGSIQDAQSRNLEYVAKAGKGYDAGFENVLEATYSTTHLEKAAQYEVSFKIRKESSNEEDMARRLRNFYIYRMINRYQTLANYQAKTIDDRKEWYSMLPEIWTADGEFDQLANAVDGSEKGGTANKYNGMVNTQLVYRRLVPTGVLGTLTSRYYYVKPTMHLYLRAVQKVAFAVILITPRMLKMVLNKHMLRAMGTYVAAAAIWAAVGTFANMYDSNLAYLARTGDYPGNSFYLHCRFGKPRYIGVAALGQDQRGSYRLGTFYYEAINHSTGAFAQPDAGRGSYSKYVKMGGSQALNAPPQFTMFADPSERFLGLRRYSNAMLSFEDTTQLKDSGWVTGLFGGTTAQRES